MSTFGLISLVLALIAAVYTMVISISPAVMRNRARLSSIKNGVVVVCVLVSLSVLVLLFALIGHNFQLEYVASYSSTNMSLPYLVSALWAGNAGSLLLWAWILSVFSLVAVIRKQNVNKELISTATFVLMFVLAFFIILLLSVLNPFTTLAEPPAEGVGLNPLLENPGMIFHPPFLLDGYVALTVPFSFAIAALVTRRLGNEWVSTVRRWSLFSWLLLGVGNLIGAWWAYVELGWGGYWAWDPVENAGLMPWLLVTALLHSMIMQRRRNAFKLWNMVLVVLAFNLTIFGTFLTRSGFISSVHTFGESALGPFFLTFIAIALIIPLWLVISRRKELKSGGEVESILSREATFLLNNLLLVVITVAVLIGTIYPAVYELVRGVKINVNQSFFNIVNTPLLLIIILLAGVCTIIGWRKVTNKELGRLFLIPFGVAVILAIVLVVLGVDPWYAVAGYSIGAFALTAVGYQWWREIKESGRAKNENSIEASLRLLRTNKPRYGAYIVHISLAIMAIGVIGSSIFDVKQEATLSSGSSMEIQGYTLTYDSMDHFEEGDKFVVTADVSVYKNDKLVDTLKPAKIFHRSYEQPVTEVAIRTTLSSDLYVILSGWSDNGDIAFEVLVNPLVVWIWIGGVIFMIGGLVAFWPRQETVSSASSETQSERLSRGPNRNRTGSRQK